MQPVDTTIQGQCAMQLLHLCCTTSLDDAASTAQNVDAHTHLSHLCPNEALLKVLSKEEATLKSFLSCIMLVMSISLKVVSMA